MKHQVVFKIVKATVYEEVNKHTAYEGAKADVTLYDKVRTKSGDKTMLERWWADACGLVTTVLTPYVTNIENSITEDTETIEGFAITVALPSNWNVSVADKLEDTIGRLVTDYLLQQWYLLLNIEGQANVAQANEQTEIAAIGQLLYTRVRPTRPTFAQDREALYDDETE